MAHEPILILDPDPSSRAQLTDILTTGGYDVYGVKAADRLVEAVKASPFPALMIDLWLPNVDRGALLESIHAASPNTAVIMMGEKQVFAWLLEVFRAGAADFVLKPYDPIEVRERVDRALARRHERIEAQGRGPSGATPASLRAVDPELIDFLKAVRTFQEQSLEVFLDLERRNLELERENATLKNPAAEAEISRTLSILAAHPDPGFSEGLVDAVTTFGAAIEPQAVSGGECLDRLGGRRLDVVLVSSDLPDIPGSIVASSVKSQYPAAEVVLMHSLGPSELRLQVIGDGEGEASAQTARSQQELINIIRERCRHRRDRQEARLFAQEFRGRHEDYIRSLANLKSRLDKTLSQFGH